MLTDWTGAGRGPRLFALAVSASPVRVRARPLVFARWRLRHAVKAGSVPDGSQWWWPGESLAEKIAVRARRAVQARG